MRWSLPLVFLTALASCEGDHLPLRFQDREYDGAFEVVRDDPAFFAAFPFGTSGSEQFRFTRDTDEVLILSSSFLLPLFVSEDGAEEVVLEAVLEGRNFTFETWYEGPAEDGQTLRVELQGKGRFSLSGEAVSLELGIDMSGYHEGRIELVYEGDLVR